MEKNIVLSAVVICLLCLSALSIVKAASLVQLTSPSPSTDGVYGFSVACGGGYIVVGTGNEVVYVYYASNGSLAATLTSPNPTPPGQFGQSVAISGKIIVVGAPYEDHDTHAESGSAYIFSISDLSATPITLTSQNIEGGGWFGYAVATNGTHVVVSATGETVVTTPYAGRAYVYTVSGTYVTTLVSPNPSNDAEFGNSLAIGGGYIVVGAPGETVNGITSGRVYVYDLYGTYVRTLSSTNPTSDENFGYSVAVGGRKIIVGAYGDAVGRVPLLNAGKVYLFNADGTLLKTLTSMKPQEDGYFGCSVATDGTTLVVGAAGENATIRTTSLSSGRAYVFTMSGVLSKTLTSLNPQNDGYFGLSVAIGGGKIVVGAPFETVNSILAAGRAYVYNPQNDQRNNNNQ